MEKGFIITIDTEGDNNWRPMASLNSINNRISVVNGRYIPRFQSLCEKFDFIPTYLVDWEMTFSNDFVSMAKEKLKESRLDIGMHMHAWSCPPYYEFPEDDCTERGNPYISEYPLKIIEEKVKLLTAQIKKVFGMTDLVSHRGGRWCINESYIKILIDNGYRADCSVTPLVNWHDTYGMTMGSNGPDYSDFYQKAYFISVDDISKDEALKKDIGNRMLEVPVTTMADGQNIAWLRPNGRNLETMKKIVDEALINDSEYVMFMLHSSELMPFGSPNFRTDFEIERLYKDINDIFSYIKNHGFFGIGLSDFYKEKIMESQ